MSRASRQARRRLGRLGRQRLIWTTMAAIECADLRDGPLVSVVMATRDRRELLEGAIESVRAQSYANWELVIVDDASEDGTAGFLAELADPRIRTVKGTGTGLSAARNSGLAAAGGELIAYLDDDNRLHRGWLKAVAWAFTVRPETQLAYGARIIDRISDETLAYPIVQLRPFSRGALRHSNYIDAGAIAHRAGLPGASFAEDLPTFGDWELLLRLSREHRPWEIPAIACLYTHGAPGRLSQNPGRAEEWQRMRQLLRRG